MNSKKRVVFLTGTRADFGKLKPLISALQNKTQIETHIFATGMHVSRAYGNTVKEIERSGFKNIQRFSNDAHKGDAARTLAKTVDGFSVFVKKINPTLIIVHGDRVEALAGALVGALNNVLVGHVEGGEVSGTVDEHLRHAISKLSHLHFVANTKAKKRLIQMGENTSSVFVIGSPDIDVMISTSLPSISDVFKHYDISQSFKEYGVVLYHPVVTESAHLRNDTRTFVDALVATQKKFIVVHPNNDSGSKVILEEYRKKLLNNPNFALYPSMRFEYFLTLIKHARCMVGNSSAGIREAPFYGIPSIDVGSRQNGRLEGRSPSVKRVGYDKKQISKLVEACFKRSRHYESSRHFGDGKSAARFLALCKSERLWNLAVQKMFIDLHY